MGRRGLGALDDKAPGGSPMHGLLDDEVADPFTPRAKKVLELSLREALQLNHSYIGTEHMLLGLVREGEGVATTVLVGLGADPARVRQQVMEFMSEGGEVVRPGEARGGFLAPIRSGIGSFGDEPLAGQEPRCPQCRVGLSEEARFRRMSVASADDEANGDPLSVDVVYCSRCGMTLNVFRGNGPGSGAG